MVRVWGKLTSVNLPMCPLGHVSEWTHPRSGFPGVLGVDQPADYTPRQLDAGEWPKRCPTPLPALRNGDTSEHMRKIRNRIGEFALRGIIYYVVSMNSHPSTTTMFTPPEAAEAAGISPKTLYDWLNRGMVVPSHDLNGSRPIFTAEEVQRIRELAAQRKQVLEAMRLPKVPA
jgi:hypothetical protein